MASEADSFETQCKIAASKFEADDYGAMHDALQAAARQVHSISQLSVFLRMLFDFGIGTDPHREVNTIGDYIESVSAMIEDQSEDRRKDGYSELGLVALFMYFGIFYE